MEFASFFSSVGVKVSVIEMLEEILPPFDPEISKTMRKELKDVDFHLGCKVESIGKDTVTFTKNGDESSIDAEAVLMAVGRSPNIAALKPEKINLDVEKHGIRVDEKMQTNLPNIYAVGDVNGLSALAHSASRMGEVVVNNLTGRPDRMRYHAIPWVVYSYPEIAAVGMTEEQAKEQGRNVESMKLQMLANGRYQAETERGKGFCKVVVDADTRVLLGVHMIGSHCSEMIFGAVAMIEAEFRVEDIRDLVFPHPTVSEIFRDTVWALPF